MPEPQLHITSKNDNMDSGSKIKQAPQTTAENLFSNPAPVNKNITSNHKHTLPDNHDVKDQNKSGFLIKQLLEYSKITIREMYPEAKAQDNIQTSIQPQKQNVPTILKPLYISVPNESPSRTQLGQQRTVTGCSSSNPYPSNCLLKTDSCFPKNAFQSCYSQQKSDKARNLVEQIKQNSSTLSKARIFRTSASLFEQSKQQDITINILAISAHAATFPLGKTKAIKNTFVPLNPQTNAFSPAEEKLPPDILINATIDRFMPTNELEGESSSPHSCNASLSKNTKAIVANIIHAITCGTGGRQYALSKTSYSALLLP